MTDQKPDASKPRLAVFERVIMVLGFTFGGGIVLMLLLALVFSRMF
jgi:hypothetical protein